MWVRFVRDYDLRVTRCMMRCYKRGMKAFVHEKHVAQIVDSGAGCIVDGPQL
jgi:hypothetical protein